MTWIFYFASDFWYVWTYESEGTSITEALSSRCTCLKKHRVYGGGGEVAFNNAEESKGIKTVSKSEPRPWSIYRIGWKEFLHLDLPESRQSEYFWCTLLKQASKQNKVELVKGSRNEEKSQKEHGHNWLEMDVRFWHMVVKSLLWKDSHWAG